MKIRGYSAAVLLLFIIGAAVILVSCYDAVELENRLFVSVLCVDVSNEPPGGISVTVITPGASGKDNDSKGYDVKTGSAHTLPSALRDVSEKSDKSLYYGLARVCVLGWELLSAPELLAGVLDSLGRSAEFNGRIVMLASTSEAKKLISKDGDGPEPSSFVSGLYKNAGHFSRTPLKLDLEGLTRALSESNRALIPILEKSGEGYAVTGGAVITEGCLAGYLDDDDMRGLSWIFCESEGERVEDGNGAVMRVSGAKLDKKDNILSVRGVIESYDPQKTGIEELENSFAREIEQEIKKSAETLNSLTGADIPETTVKVTVKITNTGSVF